MVAINSKACLRASSSVFERTSSIKIAAGSPSIKKRFFCCSRLLRVQSRITLSIISQAYSLCCIPGTTASKQAVILSKCAATITPLLGGSSSNCNVISVVNARVPSLPESNLHILNGCSLSLLKTELSSKASKA